MKYIKRLWFALVLIPFGAMYLWAVGMYELFDGRMDDDDWRFWRDL